MGMNSIFIISYIILLYIEKIDIKIRNFEGLNVKIGKPTMRYIHSLKNSALLDEIE